MGESFAITVAPAGNEIFTSEVLCSTVPRYSRGLGKHRYRFSEEGWTMKVRMTIPLHLYRRLETECDATSKRFIFIKNGMIDDDKAQVIIRCEGETALDFISWADKRAPGAVSQIHAAPEE